MFLGCEESLRTQSASSIKTRKHAFASMQHYKNQFISCSEQSS
nr:MAG TPA: hypothetical protein [Caudoviricetes sp.]